MTYSVVQADLIGDKQPLIEFWNSFNEKRLDHKFTWIYEENPDGAANVWLLKHDSTQDIVGMLSVFPRKFCFSNTELRTGILGDFFIAPKHRSLGPALMLTKAISKHLDDSEYDLIYGIPNRNAEPVLRRAGFVKLGNFEKFVRLYNIRRALQDRYKLSHSITHIPVTIANKLLNFLYRDTWHYNFNHLSARTTQTPDPMIDRLIEDYQAIHSTSRKSFDLLAWKYAEDPDERNYFYNVFDNTNRLVGCIVYTHDQNTIEIRESIFNDRANAINAYSLFINEMKNTGSEYVYLNVFANADFRGLIDELQLTRASPVSSIYYKLSDSSKKKHQASAMLQSRKFLLFETDQDT